MLFCEVTAVDEDFLYNFVHERQSQLGVCLNRDFVGINHA
jgi:hypothetical protein